MQPFVVNAHGRLVFPSNFTPDIDVDGMNTLDELEKVVKRDFNAKAPTGTDIRDRIEAGKYSTRYDLLRDMLLNLFWTNRYAMTMYDKRPTRWADVPRGRSDVFLPVVTPWVEGEQKVAAVQKTWEALPDKYEGGAEQRVFDIVFDVFRNRRHHATALPPVKPTVAEILTDPSNMTFRLRSYDPDFPTFGYEAIRDVHEDVPELEALLRWAMVIHDQYPWDRSQVELAPVGELSDDDYVVVFRPRNADVARFLERVKAGEAPVPQRAAPPEPVKPYEPYPAVDVRSAFTVMPRLEALAAVKGELACTNEDVIRNTAYSWSPMSADWIREATGIESRAYSTRPLEDLALQAAQAALAKSGRGPEEIGAVLFCTCTSTRLIPSLATWVAGQLGIYQTHVSCDIIAACAGMPYGISEATRLLQEVRRPVLLICAEKFSDKIGTVRPSRMIFGDGASAMVIGPAPEGAEPDIDVLQSYAGGPFSEVNSIIWPNPAFGNALTLVGPEVRSLAGRFLIQMIEELKTLPSPRGSGSLLADVELIVPHQANKTMVTQLAEKAGLTADQLYFDIDRVGNLSAASIPVAIADAVEDGVITKPTRIFAPGFGAGAVAGYSVMLVDPSVVVTHAEATGAGGGAVAQSDHDAGAASSEGSSAEAARVAFGD